MNDPKTVRAELLELLSKPPKADAISSYDSATHFKGVVKKAAAAAKNPRATPETLFSLRNQLVGYYH